MSDPVWERLREEARDPRKRILSFGEPNVPGCLTCQIAIPGLPHPVATVWYRWVGNHTIETLNSYVVEQLRRCGLRTALHEALLAAYPTALKRIITASGTEGGLAWLGATGFKRRGGDWLYEVRPPQRRKRRARVARDPD